MKTNKYKTKVKVNFTINKNTSNEFNVLSKEKAINKSGLIELLITNWINKNK